MLQLQMRKKTQEFQAAWQEVQEDLAREQRERAAVQSQLSAAIEQVGRAPAGARLGVQDLQLGASRSGGRACHPGGINVSTDRGPSCVRNGPLVRWSSTPPVRRPPGWRHMPIVRRESGSACRPRTWRWRGR